MILKQIFDRTTSFLALVVLLPVLAVIAVLVKLSSTGPVFFRQTRIGRNGQLFQLIKFRTMAHDTTHKGPSITIKGDARITKIGAFLRYSKLDELPQLLNIVKGEMSIVGPRPEVAKYVDLWPKDDRELILSARPGLTDYAAIEFRDEEKILQEMSEPQKAYVEIVIPRKLKLYKKYISEMSFLTDLKIIMKTLLLLLARKSH